MDRDNYIEGIRSAWLGERLGEVFFRKLAEQTEEETLQQKWLVLAQLEKVTGSKMASLLESHGESATTTENIDVDSDVISRYTSGSHQEAMLHMKEVVEKAVARFDQLLAVAPEDDIADVQFLVHHELALLSFVDHEIEGNPGSALNEVEKLLQSA